MGTIAKCCTLAITVCFKNDFNILKLNANIIAVITGKKNNRFSANTDVCLSFNLFDKEAKSMIIILRKVKKSLTSRQVMT